ncbi:hypothetical protein E2C01_049480 [Portunus trituberculatus]|uniref:Uncharacterized protein n=1 Tax=Portunus trituberculatus TaxID=210409 RepID=A0A5B7G5P1_PORTR|nr:hypothetical protein [Portunus trituberculatus]
MCNHSSANIYVLGSYMCIIVALIYMSLENWKTN